MRAWIVDATEPLPIDAGERQWRCGMLCDVLLAHGHEVHWWSSTFHHARKVHRYPTSQTLAPHPGLSLRLLHGPGYRRNLSLGRIIHNRIVAKAFAEEAARMPRPDFAFCTMPTPELAEKGVELGSREGFPVIVDVNDLWPDSYLGMLPRPLRKPARLALIPEFRRMSRICQHADGLTAVSETYLAWALGYARRSRSASDGVFPLAYPASAEPPAELQARAARLLKDHQIPEDRILVTFVGMFGSTYDLETVIDAARILEQQRSAVVQIVLVGDGEKTSSLRARAARANNVTFTGWLNDMAVRALLASSSIGLAPYTASAPQSMPNKPFEYMAAGLALVSSLDGELRSLLESENIGLYYRPGDAASLAEAIASLCDGTERRALMGANGYRIYAEHFRGSVVYPRLAQHLEAFAKDRPFGSQANGKDPVRTP
jgi:glycosyltransferase involved in cell wall biosynthesis